jgi:hypothetical protein
MIDLIGVWIGAILTLFVFSFLLGDTPLFRFAQAIFVGVAVGYATTVAIYLVLLPLLFEPLLTNPGRNWPLVVPLILGLLLLLKVRAVWAPFGNIGVGFLFGVGGALAIGGALSGTLVPQAGATVISLSPTQGLGTTINNLILAIGTIGALLSFRFTIGGGRPITRNLDALGRGWGSIGRYFVVIAFGAIFAQTAISRISVLIGRIYYLLHDWLRLV